MVPSTSPPFRFPVNPESKRENIMETPSTTNLERLPPEDRVRVERTFAALRKRNVEPVFVPDRAAAFATVLEMQPKGKLVSHGTSTTLIEIGLVEALRKPGSGFRYGNAEWQAEPDADKRGRLRARITAESDAFLGSVQALCETGEAIGADATGSRQAGYLYGLTTVIWVVGMNKLVPTVEDGLRRLREVALPQEDARMKRMGASGSAIGKIVIFETDRPGRIHLLLVGEKLGF